MNRFTFFNGKFNHENIESKIIKITHDIAEKNELIDIYKELLNFPYCGHNWDALYDCIADLEWIIEYEIVIIHEDIPLKNSRKNQKIYLELLIDAISFWQSDKLHKLIVVFPDKFREEIKVILNENKAL